MTVRSTGPVLRFGPTIAQAWRLWRHNLAQLGLVAVVAALPMVAIVEALLHRLNLQPSPGTYAALVVAGVTVAAAGEALCAGLAEHLLRHHHIGLEPRPLRHHLRSLPVATLTALALIVGAAVAVGLTLLVVPGLAAFAWLAVAAPAAGFERLGVRAALRASVALVRGRFWRVAAVTTATFVPTGVVEILGEVLHARHVATWLLIVTEAFAEAAAISLTAAVVVVVYHALRTGNVAARPVDAD